MRRCQQTSVTEAFRFQVPQRNRRQGARLPFCIEHACLALSTPQPLLSQAKLAGNRVPDIIVRGASLQCAVEGFKTRAPKLSQQADATTYLEKLAQHPCCAFRSGPDIFVQGRCPVTARAFVTPRSMAGGLCVSWPVLTSNSRSLIGLAELVKSPKTAEGSPLHGKHGR